MITYNLLTLRGRITNNRSKGCVMDVEKKKCVNRLADGNEAWALFSDVYGRFELQLCRNFPVTANTALVSQDALFAA